MNKSRARAHAQNKLLQGSILYRHCEAVMGQVFVTIPIVIIGIVIIGITISFSKTISSGYKSISSGYKTISSG